MTLSRRTWLLFAVACAMVPVARGDDTPIGPAGPTLQTTLEKGLRARRQVEFDFIANVVQLVDAGTLPQSLVETSFLWARKRQPYPYPYFRQSLKLQAQKIGVQL